MWSLFLNRETSQGKCRSENTKSGVQGCWRSEAREKHGHEKHPAIQTVKYLTTTIERRANLKRKGEREKNSIEERPCFGWHWMQMVSLS